MSTTQDDGGTAIIPGFRGITAMTNSTPQELFANLEAAYSVAIGSVSNKGFGGPPQLTHSQRAANYQELYRARIALRSAIGDLERKCKEQQATIDKLKAVDFPPPSHWLNAFYEWTSKEGLDDIACEGWKCIEATVRAYGVRHKVKDGPRMHACPDWDGLMIGPGDTEMRGCACWSKKDK